jgi:hypothetical protein
MTARLIDVMCFGHRALILGNRMWPAGFDLANCPNCTDDRDEANILPGIDPAQEMSIHEAGHAFAWLSLGVEVIDVDLGGNSRFRAYTNYRSYNLGSFPELIGLWAGAAATRNWIRRVGALTDAAEIDIAMTARSDIQLIIENCADPDAVAETRDLADRLVARHWGSIERIADALLVAGRLSGEAIAAIAQLPCNA